MGDDEAWNEAWRCICKGVKKSKAPECSSIWMSEYYCKYCEPIEKKLLNERKKKALEEHRTGKPAGGKKKSRNSECAAALDGIFPSAAEDKFLRESEFDGREFRDGKTWAMGFPRGNYLPPLRVRLPRDWKPSDVTGCPESRLTIAGRCPCCAAVIKRDQEMIP